MQCSFSKFILVVKAHEICCGSNRARFQQTENLFTAEKIRLYKAVVTRKNQSSVNWHGALTVALFTKKDLLNQYLIWSWMINYTHKKWWMYFFIHVSTAIVDVRVWMKFTSHLFENNLSTHWCLSKMADNIFQCTFSVKYFYQQFVPYISKYLTQLSFPMGRIDWFIQHLFS